jgi:hypothetical protein
MQRVIKMPSEIEIIRFIGSLSVFERPLDRPKRRVMTQRTPKMVQLRKRHGLAEIVAVQLSLRICSQNAHME